MFKNEKERLYYCNDGEMVCIEPWGENALRVRASRNRAFTEQDWALEEPAEHHGTVEIFEDASADGMAYANMYTGKDTSYGRICNGKIRAVINADGVLSFEKADGTLLLKENWRRLQDEISAPLNIFGREYRPGDGENYETTVRFLANDKENLWNGAVSAASDEYEGMYAGTCAKKFTGQCTILYVQSWLWIFVE